MKLSYIAKIIIPLLLICAVAAGAVSGIELLTRGAIGKNEELLEKERESVKLEIMSSLYGDTEFRTVANVPAGADEVRISEAKEVCVTLTCDGYKKDSISLFVAFDSSLSVLRVCVLSSQETTGIGTKVSDESYLSGYVGVDSDVTLGKNGIDKIAGATISSRAVSEGVNLARSVALSVLNGG